MICSTNQTIRDSNKVAGGIAKHGKLFNNGVFAKEAFLNYAEVLFDDSPNKCTIILGIKDMPLSPRTVDGGITDMTTDVTKHPSVALKAANFFIIGLDESIDMNDNPRLAVVARYCSNGEVHEELCCLKPTYCTTKEKIFLTPSPRILRRQKLI